MTLLCFNSIILAAIGIITLILSYQCWKLSYYKVTAIDAYSITIDRVIYSYSAINPISWIQVCTQLKKGDKIRISKKHLLIIKKL